jgi:multicomponent K+:H+ antiporter subunit E
VTPVVPSAAGPGTTSGSKLGTGTVGRRRPPGWVDHPFLSLGIAATWLLLHQTVVPAQLITALVLGLLLPRVLHRFLAPPSRIAWAPVPRLLLIVLWDIVLANFAVARLVLSPRLSIQPGWVSVPLSVSHPTAIVLLAAIITTTPGTVSCRVDERRRRILVHALDMDDADALSNEIRTRYEAPLKAIFEPC